MQRQLSLSAAILVFLLLYSCNHEKADKSGVVFTFDDQYITEWFEARDLFKEYNIKATFFINRPQNLTIEKVEMLKKLEKDGHEIACHSMNHIDLPAFLANHALNEYMNQEVIPAIEIMKHLGFNVTSYAYPFGKGTPKSDSLLLKHFKILRKATYNIENVELDKIDRTFTKFGATRVVDAMGIDKQYDISIENLERGMIRAQSRREILVLHAHCIVDTGLGYKITKDYLKQAFALSKKHHLTSLTISSVVK
jgi:peptidoglycan/xylan/chitin deacetylase (PgdA/CDA1 family)